MRVSLEIYGKKLFIIHAFDDIMLLLLFVRRWTLFKWLVLAMTNRVYGRAIKQYTPMRNRAF